MSVYKGGQFYPSVEAAMAADPDWNNSRQISVGDVTGLSAALGGKSDVNHTHNVNDIYPLPLTEVIDGGTFF